MILKYIWIISLGFIFAKASYKNLAKLAGISEYQLDNIVQKIVKIETRTGAYDVVNRRSGAYGKYQIMPHIAKAYTDTLNIPEKEWKKPKNQDKIFFALLKDNIKRLKKYGYKITLFTLYGAHQQGFNGFYRITKNKKLTPQIETNIRSNLPQKYSKIKKIYLKLVWILFWKKKLSKVK